MDFRVLQVAPDSEHWPKAAAHHRTTVGYMEDPADKGEYYFFIAIDGDGEYLGGSAIDLRRDATGPLAGQLVGCLEDVDVLPDHRRRGIATALVRAVLEFAWSRDAGHVWWTAAFDNAAGVALYRSLGVAMTCQSDTTDGKTEEYYFIVAQNPARVC